MKKIEIPLSKTKNILILLGALSFVTLGVFFIITPDTFISPIMKNHQVIIIAGILSVLFFGMAGVYGVKKLFDKRIGLTIDQFGIIDNTNASSVGLIKWADITDIKTGQIASTKFLLIYISNPEFYLEKVKGFKRKIMEGNNRMYGTPITITSTTLKCKFSDLEKLINDKFSKQQQKL